MTYKQFKEIIPDREVRRKIWKNMLASERPEYFYQMRRRFHTYLSSESPSWGFPLAGLFVWEGTEEGLAYWNDFTEQLRK